MTTPQNQLYVLSERIRDIHELFRRKDEDGDDEYIDIFEKMDEINLQMSDIISSQQRQENLMNLIVKLLSKDEKKKS